VGRRGRRRAGRADRSDLEAEDWAILRFLRAEHARAGETPTLRRASTGLSIPVKRLFELFPVKPAKKMAYVVGLPKPHGCVEETTMSTDLSTDAAIVPSFDNAGSGRTLAIICSKGSLDMAYPGLVLQRCSR
jgi:hypothetical protein